MYQRLWSLYYDCRSGAAFRIKRIYIHTKFQVKNLFINVGGNVIDSIVILVLEFSFGGTKMLIFMN